MAWTAVLVLCALCCAAASVLAWRVPRRGAARALATGSAGAVLWCAGDAVLSTSPDAPVVVTARLLTTAGAVVVTACTYWMARTATDPHHRAGTLDVLVLAVPPLLVLPALASNPWHQLLYVDTPLAAGGLRSVEGPLYPVLTALLAVPAALCLLQLAVGLLRSPGHFRLHLRTLLLGGAATAAAVAVSAVASASGEHVDVVPVGLAVAAVSAVHGLLRRHLLAVVPLARAQVVEELADAVLVVDPGAVVVDVNAACRALLRRLAGGTGADAPAIGRRLDEVLPFSVTTAQTVVHPLPELHLDVRASEIRGPGGAVVGRAVLLRDVSEVVERRIAAERTSARLADEAARDPLTGLLNRRGLREAAALLPGSAPLAAVILDVDHFKAVNDTHGHEAGDAVLQGLATALLLGSPAGALVSRLGGEELAVVLPGLDVPSATAVAQDLLAAVRACASEVPTLTGRVELRVTVSAGVADGTAADLSGVLRRADDALYAAKRGGRDRVEVAAPAAREPQPS